MACHMSATQQPHPAASRSVNGAPELPQGRLESLFLLITCLTLLAGMGLFVLACLPMAPIWWWLDRREKRRDYERLISRPRP